MNRSDVVVMGEGGARLSAALVLSRAQVITSAGAGGAAAIALNAVLVADDGRNAVHDLDHGFPPSPTKHTYKKESG